MQIIIESFWALSDPPCVILTKKGLFTLFKTLISKKVCHFELQNKIHIIRIKKLEFIQFKWQRLKKHLWSFRFLKSNAPIFSCWRKYSCLSIRSIKRKISFKMIVFIGETDVDSSFF